MFIAIRKNGKDLIGHATRSNVLKNKKEKVMLVPFYYQMISLNTFYVMKNLQHFLNILTTKRLINL